MVKDKKLYIGFSFFLVIITILLLFCVYIVFKGNNKTYDNSVTAYLKYNNLQVEEIDINKINSKVTNYDFSVIGFSVNKNISYDIILTSNIDDISVTLVELNQDNQELDITNKNKISSDTVLFSDNIKSGEVAYGKNFRLKIVANKKISHDADIKIKLKINNN